MRFKDDWACVGQNGTLQGQYLQAPPTLLRDPLTVIGRVRSAGKTPQVMQAFAGYGIAAQKEWSFFSVPYSSAIELSIEIQLPGNMSAGTNIANAYDARGWHTVALSRHGATWMFTADGDSPRSRQVTEEIQEGSVLTLGYTPGMFLGTLYAKCDLRDWRVWQAALTPGEIDAEYASSGPVRNQDLFAWWPLDRYGISDRSPNHNDLTVVSDSGSSTIA